MRRCVAAGTADCRGARASSALVVGLLWLGCLATPAWVWAQDESGGREPGLLLGSFRASPSVVFENSYNDNVFATEDDEVDDYLLTVVPALEVESRWRRHSLSARGEGKIHRYGSETSEDNEEYSIDGVGRLDLPDSATLSLLLNHGRRTVGRANVENDRRTDPEQLDLYSSELILERVIQRIELTLAGSVRRLDFRQSADADRDRFVYAGRSRVAYRFSPGFSVFAEPRAAGLDYDDRVDDDGVERSALLVEGRGGVRIDLESTFEAEIGVGAVHIGFDEARFDDVTTTSVLGEARWHATHLTRVDAEVARTIAPTSQDGASSKTETSATIGLRHALLRNVTLRAEGSYLREKFRELGRTDNNYRLRTGLAYELNRFLTVDLEYRYRVRNSDFAGEDFQSNVGMLTLEFRL